MNLNRHITITQNPQFIAEMTHDVVHSMCLDKYIMTCIYITVVESIFTALEIICALQMNLSTKQNTLREIRLAVAKVQGQGVGGRDRWRGIEWEAADGRCKLFHLGWINKVLLYSMGLLL